MIPVIPRIFEKPLWIILESKISTQGKNIETIPKSAQKAIVF